MGGHGTDRGLKQGTPPPAPRPISASTVASFSFRHVTLRPDSLSRPDRLALPDLAGQQAVASGSRAHAQAEVHAAGDDVRLGLALEQRPVFCAETKGVWPCAPRGARVGSRQPEKFE